MSYIDDQFKTSRYSWMAELPATVYREEVDLPKNTKI